MRKIGIAVLVTFLIMMGGSAWAYNATDHVKIAPNGVGDVLIYPVYAAFDGGYMTKLTVTNTSETLSVVSKLIIRSNGTSEELLDFLIYLSPGDVWTGILKMVNGKPGIESTDGSVLIQKEEFLEYVFASEDEPMSIQLLGGNAVSCPALDYPNLGYVTVITSWWFDTTLINTNDLQDIEDDLDINDLNEDPDKGPVSHELIAYLYDQAVSGAVEYGCFNNLYNLTNPVIEPTTCTRLNLLTGHFEIVNAVTGLNTASALRATVLKDYGNQEQLRPTAGTVLGDAADNTTAEISAALAKDLIAMPYVNYNSDVTMHFFTFPTKLHFNSNGCTYVNGADDDFWTATKGRCIDYAPVIYDLDENRKRVEDDIFSGIGGGPDPDKGEMCNEVQLIATKNGPFDNSFSEEGWVLYKFNDPGNTPDYTDTINFLNEDPDIAPSDPDSYEGVPVIPTVLYIQEGFMSLMQGGWDDGIVFHDTDGNGIPDVTVGVHEGYHYVDDSVK